MSSIPGHGLHVPRLVDPPASLESDLSLVPISVLPPVAGLAPGGPCLWKVLLSHCSLDWMEESIGATLVASGL